MIKTLSEDIEPRGLVNNRLQKLYLGERTGDVIKEEIFKKVRMIEILESISIYGGCAFFCLHMFRNKFKIQKTTPLYATMPFILGYGLKTLGFFWLDF